MYGMLYQSQDTFRNEVLIVMCSASAETVVIVLKPDLLYQC